MNQRSLFPKKRTGQTEPSATLDAYWTLTAEQLLSGLNTTRNGLREVDAQGRLKQYGPNTLKVRRLM